jgi:hypothetical protein
MAEHLNEPAAAPPAAVRRPLAVTLVGLLAFPVGIYNVVDGVLVLAGGGTSDRLAAGALTLALGVLAILIGLGALGMAAVGLGCADDVGGDRPDSSDLARSLLQRHELRRHGALRDRRAGVEPA